MGLGQREGSQGAGRRRRRRRGQHRDAVCHGVAALLQQRRSRQRDWSDGREWKGGVLRRAGIPDESEVRQAVQGGAPHGCKPVYSILSP